MQQCAMCWLCITRMKTVKSSLLCWYMCLVIRSWLRNALFLMNEWMNKRINFNKWWIDHDFASTIVLIAYADHWNGQMIEMHFKLDKNENTGLMHFPHLKSAIQCKLCFKIHYKHEPKWSHKIRKEKTKSVMY